MANHHFGEIGDVWKHLPLLAAVAIERPMVYWESHAGSAAYAWESGEARRFGAERFLALSRGEPALGETEYAAALGRSMEQRSPVYPGSPRLMLESLSCAGTRFVFCDLDGSSIASIELDAERAGVRASALECVNGDGNRELIDRVGALGHVSPGRVLAMLDPFSLETVGDGGVSSLDALHSLALAGVKVLLWWCARTPAERQSRRMLIERALDGNDACAAATHTIIVGEDGDSESTADRFGVWSCAVTLVNMSGRSRGRSAALGQALAQAYSNPDVIAPGVPGLRFEACVHAINGATL